MPWSAWMGADGAAVELCRVDPSAVASCACLKTGYNISSDQFPAVQHSFTRSDMSRLGVESGLGARI